MSKVISWEATYDDGKVYSSDTTKWSTLPASGLQIVMLFFDTFDELSEVRHRRIIQGSTYVYQATDLKSVEDGTGFIGTEDLAEAQKFARDPATIKTGTWVDARDFLAFEDTALIKLEAPLATDDIYAAELPPKPDPTPVLIADSTLESSVSPTLSLFSRAVAWVKGRFK